MSERAAYSRVYWTVVDDPKFATIYDNDHHLAGWLRMLLLADQAHPASGQIPATVRPASVKALVDAGLVDVTGKRFRIHGLDAERERRRFAATTRGPNGAPANPDGTPTVPEGGPRTRRGLDETRRGLDETRRGQAPAPKRAPEPTLLDERELTEAAYTARYLTAQSKATGVK